MVDQDLQNIFSKIFYLNFVLLNVVKIIFYNIKKKKEKNEKKKFLESFVKIEENFIKIALYGIHMIRHKKKVASQKDKELLDSLKLKEQDTEKQ